VVALGLALLLIALLVGTDLRARAEISTNDVSLAAAVHQLDGLRAELAGAEHRLGVARARTTALTRSFDAAESSLSTTQATLGRDQAGIDTQGIDLGLLDSCMSSVEQALNQLSVGETAGGLTSLRASSSSCAAIGGAG